MAGLSKLQIAEMDWDEFADRLSTATRDTGRAAGDQRSLREFFGDEEFQVLQRLADAARHRRKRAAEERPTVILLPGIMGSNLVAIKGGVGEDLVWIDYLGLAAGQMEMLKLTADGRRESDTKIQVRTSTIDKRVYSRIVVALGGSWDVQPFAYDWRKHLDSASDSLAALIKEKYASKPVHLVAHSMGGLVGRNFIGRHKDVWESLAVDGQGGRFLMLGTPNYGSYDIPQVLTGQQKLVRMLSKLDLRHNLAELEQILGSFVGAYLMLPSPAKLDAAQKEIYRQVTWGEHPVSEDHLERAREFHLALADPATIVGDRMRYIAGCNRETLCRLAIREPGQFTYTTTFAGDGRVTHELGLLNGVPTYYVDEVHGSLPRNEKVIRAVDQLLETGQTAALPSRPVAGRAAVAGEGAWFRPVREYRLASRMEELSRRTLDKAPLDAASLRQAEEALVGAASGAEFGSQMLAQARAAASGTMRDLVIEVALGDITQVPAPVVAVGHYKGVTPINAIGAIDKCLNGWIKYATENSILGGELGQLFFIPILEKQIAAGGVVVAGMGQEGRFTLSDLRYLMQTVTYALGSLKMESYATVLIGAGAGSLPEAKALGGMLDGICEGLSRLPVGDGLKRILLVEFDPARHRRLLDAVSQMSGQLTGCGVRLTVKSGKYKGVRTKPAPGRAGRSGTPASAAFGPRLTITRDGETLRYTALTRQSVIPVREVQIQDFYLHGIAERLMSSQTLEEQEMLGRLMNTYLFPADLRDFYETGEALTVILDRTTAAIPWEMTCFSRRGASEFLGPDLRLTRQFQTLLSTTPGLAPQVNRRLRVLVIADPAPGELHLAGAALEGQEVVRLFGWLKDACGLDIEVIDRIGPAECEPVEILALLLDEEFDIVHFAGHGTYDEAKPNHSGWVFGRDKDGGLRTLSATEIFRARRVPRLVFSNACFSAAVGERTSAFDMNRKLAGLAEAFFERGVPNYIGAGWPVADGPAVEFAKEFYARAIAGLAAAEAAAKPGKKRREAAPASLGEALSLARTLIKGQGSTWGAYHHYGDATALLIAAGEGA